MEAYRFDFSVSLRFPSNEEEDPDDREKRKAKICGEKVRMYKYRGVTPGTCGLG